MDRERTFLLLSIGIFAVLAVLLVAPFVQFLLAAVLLGYVLMPVQRRLEPRVGTRVAAATLILVTIFAVVVPIALLVAVAGRQARTAVDVLRGFLSGTSPLEAFLGFQISLNDLLGTTGNNGSVLVRSVLDLFGSLTNVLIGLTVLLFALYYFLTQSGALVQWTRNVTPLSPSIQDEILARLDRLMWAVLVGNVVVAIVQGVLTGVGLFAVGFSNVVFWTVMTTVLSLLPLIGASVVWIPAAAYLFVVGQLPQAIGLFAWGTLVVSLSDNYLRPMVGGHEAKLNPGLFIIGIFGGVVAFGFMGLFFGPILLGILKVLVEVFVREYEPE